MSTHDLGEARRLAGEVLLLHRGRLVEAGAAPPWHESVRLPPPLFKARTGIEVWALACLALLPARTLR